MGLALESGISVRDLQLHLRHSSLEETQVYLEKFSRDTTDKLVKMFPNLSTMAEKTSIPKPIIPSEILRNTNQN